MIAGDHAWRRTDLSRFVALLVVLVLVFAVAYGLHDLVRPLEHSHRHAPVVTTTTGSP